MIKGEQNYVCFIFLTCFRTGNCDDLFECDVTVEGGAPLVEAVQTVVNLCG